MPGASFEAVTGRLGVGAIAFFGLFLIVDGMMVGVFDLVETIGKSVTWGIIGILPTVVVTYIVGVFCLGIAEIVLSRFPSFLSPKPEHIMAVSGIGSALLQQLYSEHLRNHELLKGTFVSFLILAVGCIAESRNMYGSIAIVWLFTTGSIALAVLSLIFSGRAAGRAAAIADAALTISMHYNDIALPQSLASYGQDDFLDVLLAELQEQEAALPLQRFTSQGGWPDDDTLELRIESLAEHKQKVTIVFHCSFNEVVPTGCADIKHSASGGGTFEVVLDLEGQRAFIPHDDDYG